MREVTLAESKQLQLQMLVDIDNYCRKKNLRYSLGGGTLLGAIRHKGYIPWDDDIDIMMPRPDYEFFISHYIPQVDYIKLQHYKNDEACAIPFAKVYDNRTCLLEVGVQNGVYVDIFPIDGLPSEEQLNEYLAEKQVLLKSIAKTTKWYKFQKGRLIRLKYMVKKLITPPRRVCINKFERFLMRYDFEKSQYAGAIVGRYAEKEHMKADVFKQYIDVLFENHIFMAIKMYDSYLTKHYGEYMQLPPKEEQHSNHSYKVWWK